MERCFIRFYDPSIIIIIPAMILVVYAQIKVTSTYNKYSRIYSGSGLTGAELASELLRQNNIYDVKVYQIRGRLTDHYDPVRKVLNLSPGVYASNSWQHSVWLLTRWAMPYSMLLVINH